MRHVVNGPGTKREPELLTDVVRVRPKQFQRKGSVRSRITTKLGEEDSVRHDGMIKKLGNDAVAILVTLRGQVFAH